MSDLEFLTALNEEPDNSAEKGADAALLIRPKARADLKAAFIYLAENSPEVGARFLEAVRSTMENLAAMPNLGAPREFADRRLHNVRQWPIADFRKYLVFYRPLASGDGIDVLRVLHASRDSATHLSEDATHNE